MQTDILIVGGGVSGLAMAAVAKKNFPDKTVLIVTEESPSQDIVFHLHRPIADLPELTDKKTIKFRSSVYTDSGITLTPTIKDINSYAEKVFNKLFITNCGNSPEFTIIPVGIQDIEKHLKTDNILYGKVTRICPSEKIAIVDGSQVSYQYLISTIPLPILLDICEIANDIKFENYPFYSTKLSINSTEMYQQLYVTSMFNNITRVTLMDDSIYIESMEEFLTEEDIELLDEVWGINYLPNDIGNIRFKRVFPGRIRVLSNKIRKPIIHGLTEKYDIMVLGRFGSWSYKIFNDVWEDAKFLCKLIKDKEVSRSWIR